MRYVPAICSAASLRVMPALGSVIYRSIIQAALSAGLDPNDMKLISAVLVVLALVLPNFGPLKQLRVKRRAQKALAAGGN